jgi:hypothetical protein
MWNENRCKITPNKRELFSADTGRKGMNLMGNDLPGYLFYVM